MKQTTFFLSFLKGSISNIGDDTDYKCRDGSSPEVRHKVISGVVGAASSVTSIQVANLLKLFKIPMVNIYRLLLNQMHASGKIEMYSLNFSPL